MSADLEDPTVDEGTLRAWSIHAGRVITDSTELRNTISEGDLPTAFQAAAHKAPHISALRIGSSEITHGELDHRVGVVASTLHRVGLGADHVALLAAPTSIEFVIGYLACLRVGAAVAVASPTTTRAEREKIWRASGASFVVGTGEGLDDLPPTVTSEAREVIGVASSDSATASVVPAEADLLPATPIDGDRPAIIAFTSGSTGAPKCVPLSHRNLLSSIRGLMMAWRWNGRDVLVHALPVTHQHGLGGVHATLLAGSRAIILPRFDPVALMETIDRESATILFGVPTVYQRLLADAPDRIGALSKLRLFTSGSAPLDIALAEQVRETVGELPLERYGSTEAGLDVSNPVDGPRKSGSVGLPLPGVEIRLLGDTDEGEILIRGPQVFAGYLPPDPSAFEAGWFRTGDIGRIDDDGYLHIVGRSKDVIISGGMNVYPREIEETLRTAEMADIIVVGVPSARWGEEVVCFVTPESAVGTIEARARELLSPHKRPKRVLAIDQIPRNAMGKPDREALKRLASTPD